MEYLIYIFPPENSVSPYWSIITSIASTIIAITALALTRRQMRISDKHNRLMVTPHISSTTHIDREKHTIALQLENNGIGPAIIKDFTIEIDGNVIEASDEVEAAIKMLIVDLPIDDWGHESLVRNSFLPAGGTIDLVTLVSTKQSPEDLIKVIDPRANVKIEYTSIYGETFTYQS